jgi:hypothetical protein
MATGFRIEKCTLPFGPILAKLGGTSHGPSWCIPMTKPTPPAAPDDEGIDPWLMLAGVLLVPSIIVLILIACGVKL